jgi:hypothetical protein
MAGLHSVVHEVADCAEQSYGDDQQQGDREHLVDLFFAALGRIPVALVGLYLVAGHLLGPRHDLLPDVHFVALKEEHLDLFFKRSGRLDGHLKLQSLTHRAALEAALLDDFDGFCLGTKELAKARAEGLKVLAGLDGSLDELNRGVDRSEGRERIDHFFTHFRQTTSRLYTSPVQLQRTHS